MAEKLNPEDLVSVAALARSGAWEVTALVELLVRKGVCTKQEVGDMIQELRRQNPAAVPTSDAIPKPSLNVQVENALIGRVDRLIELGERLDKKTTH